MAYCYDGKTYETIKEMAEEYGIDRQRIYSFALLGVSAAGLMATMLYKKRHKKADEAKKEE